MFASSRWSRRKSFRSPADGKIMKQRYFVVVLAHSLRGRLRRLRIAHQAAYIMLALALLGCFSLLGFVASYARMAWKVADYNALRRGTNYLRTANNLGLATRAYRRFLAANAQLSIWPVDGHLMGAFGERTDPFSGEG